MTEATDTDEAQIDEDQILSRLESLCAELGVKRLDPEDILELLSDGEQPAWVAEQATDEEGETRDKLAARLAEVAPLVYTPPAEDDEAEEDATAQDEGAGDAVDGEQMSPADLQAQLAELAEALPPGVDASQLEQLLKSERGQLMADFGAFCQERGYDAQPTGGMDDEMRALHDEWLQTPREPLEGKRPAELLEGGSLFPERVVTFRREEPKVGRNDPCPCGSGKKFKKCCGR